MSFQFTIDWEARRPAAVQEAIAEGMRRSDAHADPKWKHIFDACVLAAARKKPEITSDDVLDEIEALPNAPSTHDLAAIGPAMKRAGKMGVLRPTQRTVRSRRAKKNGNLHVVWESRYYTGG